MTQRHDDLLTCFSFDTLHSPHRITTRLGGNSLPPYESLNLGLHVRDDPAVVIQNRQQVAQTLGKNLDDFVLAEQTHGSLATIVDNSHKGRGAHEQQDAITDTDALITATPGVVLAINVADCVPILLEDRTSGIVAAVHAGWRGTFERIVQKALTAMYDLGAQPHDIHAGVGPGIGPCCYEVSSDLITKFHERFQIPINSRFLDLLAINLQQLLECDVPQTQIEIAPFCTSCDNQLFFSHRRENGLSGRFWALIHC